MTELALIHRPRRLFRWDNTVARVGVSAVAILAVLLAFNSVSRETLVTILTKPLRGDPVSTRPVDALPDIAAPAAKAAPVQDDAPENPTVDMPAKDLPTMTGGGIGEGKDSQGVDPGQEASKTAPLQGVQVVIGMKPAKIEDSNDTTSEPPSATFSPSKGKVVEDGLAPPLLRLVDLDKGQINALMATGNAIIIARDGDNDVYYLSSDGRFQPTNDLDPTKLGQRLVPINDNARLTTPWTLRLAGVAPERRFTFVLRFAAGLDAAMLARQLEALAKHDIDLATIHRDRRAVVTLAKFDDNLRLVITDVMIDGQSVNMATAP